MSSDGGSEDESTNCKHSEWVEKSTDCSTNTANDSDMTLKSESNTNCSKTEWPDTAVSIKETVE